MRRTTVGLVVATLLALTGCSGGHRSASPDSSASLPSAATSTNAASGQPSPTMPSAPATRPPAASATLVQFGRQGGIAGLADQLAVREDGGFTLVRARPAVNRTGQLSAAELADLRRVLDESGFAKLPRVQSAKGNDLFTYQVIYAGYEILAQDGGIEAPLRPVIGQLSGIVGRYGS
ncbi:MAG: hypothetical protein AUI14_21085 [Actinobacteria bacterium 13_2_20CM_2_71_6]|nr:MAG: hypothetical protein AUI14_21085 [Actinobacteria bacterium 13_2_20CM_2_71_6]